MSTTAASSRRRKIAGTVLVAVLAAVLIAIVVVRNGGEKVVNAGGDTLVLVGDDAQGGLDAVITGQLVDVGGCLGLAPGGGADDVVVIWPHGTNIETPEPLRVRIEGTVRELGDTVTIGGGGVDGLKPSSYFYDQVSEPCRTSKVWLANAG